MRLFGIKINLFGGHDFEADKLREQTLEAIEARKQLFRDHPHIQDQQAFIDAAKKLLENKRMHVGARLVLIYGKDSDRYTQVYEFVQTLERAAKGDASAKKQVPRLRDLIVREFASQQDNDRGVAKIMEAWLSQLGDAQRDRGIKTLADKIEEIRHESYETEHRAQSAKKELESDETPAERKREIANDWLAELTDTNKNPALRIHYTDLPKAKKDVLISVYQETLQGIVRGDMPPNAHARVKSQLDQEIVKTIPRLRAWLSKYF